MSQKAQVKKYLMSHIRGLTALEATQKFNPPIMRLSERIRELEAEGFPVSRVWIKKGKAKYRRYMHKVGPATK
jgi:hypothetical protein